jgi:hypothetical protein
VRVLSTFLGRPAQPDTTKTTAAKMQDLRIAT